MAARKQAPRETPESGLFVVRESFVVDRDGVPVAYRKGEPVDPTDPVLTRMAESFFEPLVFPHPVIRRGRLTTPEVRS